MIVTRCLQLFGLMGEVGAHQLSDVLPQVTDRLSPLFLGDHVVALCVPTPKFDQCFGNTCPVADQGHASSSTSAILLWGICIRRPCTGGM